MTRNHIAGFLSMAGLDFTRKFDQVKKYIMTLAERLYDLYKAVHFVGSASVPGDIVEVGVWKGGALRVAALASSDPFLQNDFWLASPRM